MRVLVVLVFLVFTPAFADNGPYGELRLGAAVQDADPSFAVAGSVGYAFGPGFRLEGEGGYRRVSGDVLGSRGFSDLYTVFANALYEFGSNVRPYIGAGAGLVHADSHVSLGAIPPAPIVVVEEQNTGFAWQAIGGLAFQVSETVDLVVDYRFVSTSGIELDGLDFDSESHNATGGIRFRF